MPQFRQDPVSGDWIVIAAERGKRPHALKKKAMRRRPSPKRECPFEDLEKSGNGPIILRYPEKGDWRIALVPNKFPALKHTGVCASARNAGPYRTMEGIGHHDLVITRDHYENFAHLSPGDAFEVLRVFQRRYLQVREDKCLAYVSAFANWGASAGASLFHPHYQLLALPIVPPDVAHSLRGSREYFKKHGRCAHCDIVRYERRGANIVFENRGAIVFTPFASRAPYEIRVFPKRHHPYFERTPEAVLRDVASALGHVLRRIEKKLDDPDFNFFIHTAPLRRQEEFANYHWHIEITPKVSVEGGFELSTGVDINVITPEALAKILR